MVRLVSGLLVVLACFFYSPSNAQEYTGNLLNNNNWQGNVTPCSGSDCWAGYSGGQTPSWNGSIFRWGYGGGTVFQNIGVQQALQSAGIDILGFYYHWHIKNYNAESGQSGVDPLDVTIKLYGDDGSILEQYNYDYGYQMPNWTHFAGTEIFTQPYPLEDVGTLQLSATGDDAGFWAGWYGPEFWPLELKIVYEVDACAANPLSDPTCEGYAEAYYNQQCSYDPLYDQGCTGYAEAYYTQQCGFDALYDTGCPGYEEAYYNQQCSMDALYDVGCPGYAEAYYSYQCSLDALYDNGCPGYAEAFTEQQCELNPQYSPVCDGYAFPVAETPVSEPEPVIEEPIQAVEQVQEVQIVEQTQEIAEEPTIVEEKEEEIVELSVALEQNEEKTEKSEEKPKNARRQAAIAGSLESTQQLLQQIIGSSMSSGTNESNLQGSTGDLYGNDTQNFSNLQNSSTDSQETLSQSSTSEQDSQNLNDSMALGPSLNLGISLLVNNEPKEDQKENKKPTLAERMAKMIQKKNLENQSGIFGGQESVLTDMANGANMNKYYEERLADASGWYGTKDIYGGNKMTDSNKSFYRLNSENHGTMQQLIRSQY